MLITRKVEDLMQAKSPAHKQASKVRLKGFAGEDREFTDAAEIVNKE